MSDTSRYTHVKPYNQVESKTSQLSRMFDTISGQYDKFNDLMSLGLARVWRKKALKSLQAFNPKHILDIATGTGDLAILFASTSATEIIGLDISQGMLDIGKKKVAAQNLDSKIQMVLGDGENIPYPDNYFDAITVAYGVRNFENLEKGLSEILRTLKPNGQFIILETSVPTKFPFKQGYAFHSKVILPLVGKLFSKDQSAYTYLSNSANEFPFGEVLNNILRKIGFIDVKHLPQTFGVATIYQASKK